MPEFEGRIEYVGPKSRLVEMTDSGVRYWLPKSCTFDFNRTNAEEPPLYMFNVTDWWWNKRHDFVVQDRE
jgi:hypothetical protein